MGSESGGYTKEFDMCECRSDTSGESPELSSENEMQKFMTLQVGYVMLRLLDYCTSQ